MADVLDVISRFTYEVEDTDLRQASALLQQQINSIGVYAQRLQSLQQAFDRTAASEIEKRNRIAGLIQKQKTLIDQTNQSISKQVSENQKLQNAIVKEVGLINTLTQKIKVLTEERNKAFDPKQIDSFNRQIAAAQGQLSKLTGGAKGSGLGASILQGLGIGTGVGLVTQGIGQLQQFIGESVRLATEAEGVFKAFNRLNQPNLLQNLRDSVRGTVSDLELAKQAVQFNNFGLPLERLGTALSFARQRAQDTGQSIDFLVQSIVTGIGRQSPLILDNLGINAKRVSEEFKRTGNFAEAAFNIIEEEAGKAGLAVDTFGDRVAQQNARIQNFQVRVGDFFRNVISSLLAPVEGFVALIEGIAEQQSQVEQKSIKSANAYYNEYVKADQEGRQKIMNQALRQYQFLLRVQQDAEKAQGEAGARKLQKDLDQLADFFDKAAQVQKKITFANFTSGDLRGASREQLQQIREQGDQQLSFVTDDESINRIKNRLSQIDAALERFAIRKEKHAKIIEKPIYLRLDPDDGDKFLKDLEKAEKELADADKIITDIINKRRTPDSAAGAQSLEENIRGGQGRKLVSDDEAANLRAQYSVANDQTKLRQDTKKTEDETRKKRVSAEIEAYETITNAAVQAYNTIKNAQIQALDSEIRIRETRVNVALKLAEKGNNELLEIEQKRLEESNRERQKAAQEQAAINAGLVVSNSLVAVARSAGEGGLPLLAATIAALIAGFAFVTTLAQDSQPGFAEGVVDYQGKGTAKSDSNVVRISRGESVITAEATQKYREQLEAMNAGTFQMTHAANNVYTFNNPSNFDTKRLEKKMDELTSAYRETQVRVNTLIDAYGVSQTVSKISKQDINRFKRR